MDDMTRDAGKESAGDIEKGMAESECEKREQRTIEGGEKGVTACYMVTSQW